MKDTQTENSTTKQVNSITVNTSIEGLWSLKSVAHYLGKSTRHIERLLKVPENQQGSIPHLRLRPARGNRCSIRFIPSVVMAWAQNGCPSVSTVNTWSKIESRVHR